MEKKNKILIQEKMAERFEQYCKRLKKEAKDQNISFKQYLRKRFLNKPLGDLGKTMLHGRFFALNALKVRNNSSKEKSNSIHQSLSSNPLKSIDSEKTYKDQIKKSVKKL